ncbi:MAG: hypothetical protein RLZZ579_980 [Actinomycetota bacterium]
MKMQIRFQTYFTWLVLGIILGTSASQLLVSTGEAFPLSPVSLSITLLACAVVGYLFTIPILRYRRKLQRFANGEIKERPERVNPFLAFRILVLARSVAIAGAGFLGWHLGQLIWLFAFSVAASGLVLQTIFGALGSATMLVAGLLGEQNCKTPEDPKDGVR